MDTDKKNRVITFKDAKGQQVTLYQADSFISRLFQQSIHPELLDQAANGKRRLFVFQAGGCFQKKPGIATV